MNSGYKVTDFNKITLMIKNIKKFENKKNR